MPCSTSSPSRGAPPTRQVVGRETIELVYLAALQHLPPRQRAALLLRDVVGWSASETADLLDLSVAAANSVLQRARSTIRARMPPARSEWATARASSDEQEALRRFMDAYDHNDAKGLTEVLREDARLQMPPAAFWFDGRDAIDAFHRVAFAGPIEFRMVGTVANRQPAAAAYLRTPSTNWFELVGLNVLRVVDGRIAEWFGFERALLTGFDLPPTLP